MSCKWRPAGDGIWAPACKKRGLTHFKPMLLPTYDFCPFCARRISIDTRKLSPLEVRLRPERYEEVCIYDR